MISADVPILTPAQSPSLIASIRRLQTKRPLIVESDQTPASNADRPSDPLPPWSALQLFEAKLPTASWGEAKSTGAVRDD